ncbi:MAG: TetR/AcrR family transcriptional regulator, partial [Aeromicrobium sp.]
MHQPAARPRNRRELIVDAAGRVFNERGYHATSMEEIAQRVGITAPALYRHFPNKYALFAECANAMADGLLDVLEGLPDDTGLEVMLAAVARETLAHRSSGGVYRWEARYLEADDRRTLRTTFERIVERVAGAVPAGSAFDAGLRASAALGAIGSITMHRTRVAPPRAQALLVAAAVGAGSVPDAHHCPTRASLPTLVAPRTRRDEILAASIPLFERDGFHQVALGQIAQEVGIVTSAIYRHFPAKVDILAAACEQAGELLGQAVERALAQPTSPPEAVAALTTAYVAHSFEHRALTSVAEAELVGMPPALQGPLIAAQRDHIRVWVQHLRTARPELDAQQATVLVHAAFGVVVESG